MKRFGLQTAPPARPSLERARALYAQACAACHGEVGSARTEAATRLDPPPSDFTDAERLGGLSPFRAYNAISFGVPGTGMPSYESLSPEERWELSFYVFKLGHAARPSAGPRRTAPGRAVRPHRRRAAGRAAQGRHRRAGARAHLAAGGGALPRAAGGRRDRAHAGPGAAGAHHLPLGGGAGGRPPRARRLPAGLRGAGAAAACARRERDGGGGGGLPRAARAPSRGATGRRCRRARRRWTARWTASTRKERAAMPALAGFLIYFREGIEAALLVGALLAGAAPPGAPRRRALGTRRMDRRPAGGRAHLVRAGARARGRRRSTAS